MTILFENSSDPSVLGPIPDIVVTDTPYRVCLYGGKQINVRLDGEVYMLMKRGCITLDCVGTYTFEVSDNCCDTQPFTLVQCTMVSPASGGTVTVTPNDQELLILCDSVTVGYDDIEVTKFLRRFSIVNGVVTVIDTELDGTTSYATAGTVAQCAEDIEVTNDQEVLTLCDINGATATPFLRRYQVIDGVVTTTDTELDGVTGYAFSGTVSTCPSFEEFVPNDQESFILCDVDGATTTHFIRRFSIVDGVVSVIDTTLDGTTPYVVSGTASACPEFDVPTDQELIVLCDVNGEIATQFLRRYQIVDGAVTITDTTLNGTTAYAPTGTVSLCEEASPYDDLPTNDQEVVILCDVDGATTTQFLRRFSIVDGVVTKIDTQLDGTTVYVVSGVESQCLAEAADAAVPNDQEFVVLCDINGGSTTPFLRRYSVIDGVVTITDTTLDGTTGYTVLGVASKCPEFEPAPSSDSYTTTVQNIPVSTTFNLTAGTDLVGWSFQSLNAAVNTSTFELNASGNALLIEPNEEVKSSFVYSDGATLSDDVEIVTDGSTVVRFTTIRRD